ncbi:hypothetical protein [Alteribacillus bidgolensis]|uniref:RsbT co-antagonist protein RsbR n=1 Tax=Alteribacillus bidgolensis TaxID=930129 RepID=A0A1G8L3Q9_9BACI|nr:hypothetical protein [Alteribacillus bidgolensis]SDI50343.1 hypothetical protein SAMN05216352_108141 [Alteribacillus bidgolensis]
MKNMLPIILSVAKEIADNKEIIAIKALHSQESDSTVLNHYNTRAKELFSEFVQLVSTHLLNNQQEFHSENLQLETAEKIPEADAEEFHTVILSAIPYLSSALWQYIMEDSENKGLTIFDLREMHAIIEPYIHRIAQKYMSLFFYTIRQRADSLKDKINEISVPVIKLIDKVGKCPLIGFIDDNQAHEIMEKTLRK